MNRDEYEAELARLEQQFEKINRLSKIGNTFAAAAVVFAVITWILLAISWVALNG